MDTSLIMENNDKKISYLHLRNSNTKLVIFFSSYTSGNGKFDFFKVGNNLLKKGYDILFCADYTKNWYITGIFGLGNSVEETCLSFKSIINEYTHTTTIGGSMGGYGALLFGSLLNTDIISFGSDIILQAPKSQSSKLLNIDVPQQYKDVKNFFTEKFTSKVFLFVGELDHSDLFYSHFLNTKPNINTYIIRNCFHSIPIFLNKLLLTEAFIFDLLENQNLYSYPFLTYYEELGLDEENLNYVFNNKDFHLIEKMEEINLNHQSYLVFFYIAFNLWNKKLYKECILMLKKSLIINSKNIQTMLFLAMAYREIEEYEKSLMIFKLIENESLICFPRMFFEFGLLHFKMNNFIDAIYYFLNSVQERYNIQQSKRMLRLCYKKFILNNKIKGS